MLPARFPSLIGLDAAARITAVGSSVTDLAVGDRVFVLANENWRQQRNLTQKLVVKMPDEIDDLQISMVKTNGLCCLLMLRAAEVEEGDYVIQSAPLSSVGRLNIGIAKALGYRTVNIVRRKEAIAEVQSIGGDIALLDGEDLPERVAEATDGVPIPLGLDCVAGDVVTRMADCMDYGGTIVNYGMLSGEPCILRADQTIFKELTLQGFWLAKRLNRMTHNDRVKLVKDCVDLMIKHDLSNEVGKTFSLTDVAEALDYAENPDRSGKVIFLPNG